MAGLAYRLMIQPTKLLLTLELLAQGDFSTQKEWGTEEQGGTDYNTVAFIPSPRHSKAAFRARPIAGVVP